MARAVIDLYDVEQRLDAGESVQAIAADLGVTPRTIRNRLHAAGRPLEKERRRQRQRTRLDDPTWLRDQYLEQLRNPSDIANELNVSTAEVVAALESFRIARPPVHPELTGPALAAAFAKGGSVKAIARAAGVDRVTVRREMRRHGIENPNVSPQRPAVLDDLEWLGQQYVTAGRSMQSIADEGQRRRGLVA